MALRGHGHGEDTRPDDGYRRGPGNLSDGDAHAFGSGSLHRCYKALK